MYPLDMIGIKNPNQKLQMNAKKTKYMKIV